MDLSLIRPRIYKDTFVGTDYEMDVDENLDYRIPAMCRDDGGQYAESPFSQRYQCDTRSPREAGE